MNLITAIPIYRNKFQKPAFFFSAQNFSVGSVVIAPFLMKEKPALIVRIDDAEEKKFFIRENKIKINKISNKLELKLLSAEALKNIKNESKKSQININNALEKIFTKKALIQFNNINSTKSDTKEIKKIINNLSTDFIKKKFEKSLPKITKKRSDGIQSIDNILSLEIKPRKTLHTEKHYLVDEIRNYFGEDAKSGKGSFGFYLGFFKRVPEKTIYQYWSEVKQSNKSTKDQQKIFWWKIGQYLKEKKIDKKNPKG